MDHVPLPESEAVPHVPGRADLIDPCRAAISSDAESLGRLAHSPLDIPWRGWRRVLHRTAREIVSDRVSLVAAGCAFYGTLALFPAISMLISLYGLVFDPLTVEPHLDVLRGLMPLSAFNLIEGRVHELVARPPMMLTANLLVSTGITLWSAATGTKAIISALNLAYEEQERRSVLTFQATAFGMTLIALLGTVLAGAVLVALQSRLAMLGFTTGSAALARIGSVGVLLLFVVAALSLLYRYGPCRVGASWQWVTPGSLLATGLWLVVSVVFSFYVSHFASYDATYGPLAAVAGVMMWFYVTVYVVLLGAELNAELELQTVHDSTGGAPLPPGRRGAYVADHVARD